MSHNRYALDSIPDTFEGRLKVLDLVLKSERALGRREQIRTAMPAFIQGKGILMYDATAKTLEENGFTCHVVEA